jgi:hypothetical protein
METSVDSATSAHSPSPLWFGGDDHPAVVVLPDGVFAFSRRLVESRAGGGIHAAGVTPE